MKSPVAIAAFIALAACHGEPSKKGGGPDAGSSADGGGSSPDAGPLTVPSIEPTSCRYSLSIDLLEGEGYECGDLITFERKKAEKGIVRVHFIRFFSSAESSNATIYLEGGPGGNGSGMVRRVELFGPDFLSGLLVDGDFLVIAQRGTSLSVPNLDCDYECDLDDAYLPAYNTAANADDIDELRALLGYEKLNVYGISYGSRLALEYLRRHGDHARAAVLGGLVPAHLNWPAEIPASFYSALTALDASCAADASCGSAFGDLKTDFVNAVSTLNNDPVELDGGNILLDGDTFAAFLFRIMYARSAYPWLPLVLHDLSTRRTDRVGDFLVEMIYALSNSNVARGMYYSVVCGELFNPPDASAFDIANADVPEQVRTSYSYNWYNLLDICSQWPVGNLQTELAKPVMSDVPAFVASGTIDPITPPRFGDAAADYLENSLVVTFENSGHGSTLQTECGMSTFMAFLADPTNPPDVTCAGEIETEYVLGDSAAPSLLPTERIVLDVHSAPAIPALDAKLKAALSH